MKENTKDEGIRAYSMYEIISKKRDGKELTREEIRSFINGFVKEQIPDYQAAALLMAIYLRDLNSRELSFLTEAMIDSGDTISLEDIKGSKIDKHSTGGVGDKVSFVVAPLVAACGVKVAKLSGRGLGHTGGTLDKLEAIPGIRVFLKPGEFKGAVAEVGLAICGQTENIVPADKKLYSLRDATATVGSIPLIASSIMSKKLALGTDSIILDVKVGKGAFMTSLEHGLKLCQTMVETGERRGRQTSGLITNMDQPLGRAVGNSLEIIESIEALKGSGPKDLMEVTFGIGACMLMAAGAADSPKKARQMMDKALTSGAALDIFRRFVRAQEGDERICDDYSLLPIGKFKVQLTAGTGGYVSGIDALEVGMAAVDIGAGRRKKEDAIDHGAGFFFYKKVGDRVEKGELIGVIYTNSIKKAEAGRQRLQGAVTISAKRVPEPEMIFYLVNKKGISKWKS